MAFRDRTSDWGLGGLNGFSFGVADLDGDGWADLVINHGSPYDRVSGEVYLNRPGTGGARTFVDHTEASGLYRVRDSSETGRSVSMIRFGDIDNDGDADAFTGTFMYLTDASRTALPDQPEILLNDGSGVFTLTDAQTIEGPPDPLNTDGFFFDQDLDGRLDLALGYWWEQPPFTRPFGQQPEVFRGDGSGSFRLVTDEIGMLLPHTSDAVVEGTQPRPLMGFVMCDVNDDGRQDIVGAAYGRMFNELFLADGDRFTELGAMTAIGSDDRRDYSDDESFRCYCQLNPGAAGCDGIPPSRYVCTASSPVRGWNPGSSDQPWQLGGNTFSYACADVDNDGDLDLYESNIRHPDVGSASDPSELLVNDGTGNFTRPGRETMGLTPPIDLATTDEGGQHDGAFDFDNDGHLDLYLAGSPYPRNRGWLFHQRPGETLQFEWIGAEAGFYHACPNSTGLADFDRDGDLDLVVGTYGCNSTVGLAPGESPDYEPPENQPVRFYENVSNENNWIAIRLRGRGEGGANGDGIGARVRVTAGGITQTRVVQTASHNVSSEPEAFFGLGGACDVDRIEIRWPDSALTTQVVTGVLANYRVEIREGEEAVRYLP